jgi:MFS family permease
MSSLARKTVEFLGLRRHMVGLLAMVVLVGMGERMSERFIPLYLVALGGGTWAVGLFNGFNNLISALYSLPGGWLSDRLGPRRALLIFNLIALTGYLLVMLIPWWPMVIAASFLFLSWTAVSMPATMGLISGVLPKGQHVMGVSVHSLVRRVPMALGPLVGGAIITRYGEVDGVRLAFGIAFLLGLVALFAQQRLIPDDGAHEASAIQHPFKLWQSMSPGLKSLLASDILIRFCEQIPYAFVVLWCVKIHAITPFQFGVLTAIEMTVALLIYIPTASISDLAGRKTMVVLTFAIFTAFPAVLLISTSFPMMVLAFVIRGLKEFGEPSRKTLIMELATEGLKGQMFGLYYLIRDIIVSVAAFGGAWLWMISPETNLIAATAFGVLGTLWFARK